MRIIEITQWETPATVYPDGIYGRVELRTHYSDPAFIYDTNGEKPKGDPNGYDCYKPLRPLPIKALYIDGKPWMVDDPSHWWAMQRFSDLYQGHVLVAGLGLGLIVHALQSNPKVDKITVIEREIIIISLMKNFLPYANTTFLCKDWNDYVSKEEINGVFYDLFVGDPDSLTSQAVEVMRDLEKNYPRAIHHIHGFNADRLKE